MKILSAAQIHQADQETIKNTAIASIDLMERAAAACAEHIQNMLSGGVKNIQIVCGKGNNGGDGLAIARILKKNIPENYQAVAIHVHIVEHRAEASADFNVNYERLRECKGIQIFYIEVNSIDKFRAEINSNKKESVIIDALFGSGLNKPVTGMSADVINIMNASGVPIVSVDLPSGLFCDEKTKQKDAVVVKASLVLTFQMPKLAFMMAENAEYSSEFILLDIGLDQNFIEKTPTDHFYLQKQDISPLIIPRKKFSHKGAHGHALLVAGSEGKMGAAVLAAKACLATGAGLLTARIPKCGINVMQASFPEAMVSADDEETFISALPHVNEFSAAGIGPGIGTDEQTGKVLKLLIQNFAGPVVIDADALNVLAENKTWLAFLKPRSILTPHPKEFDRIAGAHTSDFDRLESAKELAFRHNIIIVLKGAHTAIITPTKKVFFNSTGNPGLAKGGSGDILTGMITGLLARGYEALPAAMIGVFLHGLAADLATEKIHEESLLPSQVIDHISDGFLRICEPLLNP
jgi:ADP-dependent NAD(P)H-hydrate dehydratase / NAD(P)H-hydrate epimerase